MRCFFDMRRAYPRRKFSYVVGVFVFYYAVEDADGDHSEADVFAGFGGGFDVFGGCGGGCRERCFEGVGGGV